MFTVLIITTGLVILCVLIHYEILAAVTRVRDRFQITHRRWIINIIICALLAHILEITVFSFGFAVMDGLDWTGTLLGVGGDISSDYWYFSAVSYTSLGFGDITPDGPMRFAVGVETLTGLVLIAWSASMVFVEMQRSWNIDPNKK